jgi:hypothetical protein
MKKLFSTIAVIATFILTLGSPAHAAFIFTDSSFYTAPANGTLTFTFEGFSAADTDTMQFVVNGDTIFTNNLIGQGPVTEAVIAGNVYNLSLNDLSFVNTWSSDPTFNSDHSNHLASTNTFSDFRLGAGPPFLDPPPVPITTNCALAGCYLGWEDRPFPGADADYNDLVFAMQFTPTTDTPTDTPEPASMALLGSGLIAIGVAMRRRRRRAA